MIASVVRGHLHYADWGRHAWETHLSNLLLLWVLGTRNPLNAVRTPQKEFLLHVLVQSHVQGVVLRDDIFDCLRDPRLGCQRPVRVLPPSQPTPLPLLFGEALDAGVLPMRRSSLTVCVVGVRNSCIMGIVGRSGCAPIQLKQTPGAGTGLCLTTHIRLARLGTTCQHCSGGIGHELLEAMDGLRYVFLQSHKPKVLRESLRCLMHQLAVLIDQLLQSMLVTIHGRNHLYSTFRASVRRTKLLAKIPINLQVLGLCLSVHSR
mmetsp:Transcript_30778/g.59396  ORF Transcript_30778/g.59396 Transcript_30778/m.59396 type:complete len:262 (+) Transcript_30778:121-906(+)